MSDAARRFAARYGLKLEISGAVGAPGAQATNVKEFQHISPLEPRPNLPNTPGALGAESDPISVADEDLPQPPQTGRIFWGRCKVREIGPIRRVSAHSPQLPHAPQTN